MNNPLIAGWGDTVYLQDDVFGSHNYLDVFEAIHQSYGHPDYLYLEIGSNRGKSLIRSKGRTICVDPEFNIKFDIVGRKKQLLAFQETSDQFFDTTAPKYFSKEKVDLSFIDGLHFSDQVLKDFYNLEKYCDENSLIIFHDILPRTYETALKARKTIKWTGDVWKSIKVLMDNRTDYDYLIINAPPSGLLVAKRKPNIDKSSYTLEEAQQQLTNIDDDHLLGFLKTLKTIDSAYFVKNINPIHSNISFYENLKEQVEVISTSI